MTKEVILTGLRANSQFTLGNYLGGIKQMVALANAKSADYQINFFMPDLHSITVELDYSNLQKQIFSCLKQYVAAGLDLSNTNIFIYRQSKISAHSELAWIFQCFSGFGELSRMVEFKDKSQAIGADRVSAGLFSYPALMAADILLYDAKWVPVGDDQRQHIEFTRNIASRFNNKFGDLFTVPESTKKQTEFLGLEAPLRIRSLKNPTKKMSKSVVDPAGTILLTDKPSEAAKKVMSATTDSFGEISYDFELRPGVSNLLQILAHLSGKTIDDTVREWRGKSSYGELKKATASAVEQFLTGFQQRVEQVDEEQLRIKLETSEKAMLEFANKKLQLVQTAVGLR